MRFLNWEGSSKEAVPPVSLGTADSGVAQGSTWSSAFRSACWGGFVHAMRAGHPGLTSPQVLISALGGALSPLKSPSLVVGVYLWALHCKIPMPSGLTV